MRGLFFLVLNDFKVGIICFVLLIFIIVMLVYLVMKKQEKKEFLERFGVAFSNYEARNIVFRVVQEKKQEIDSQIKEAIEFLKNVDPAKQVPGASWTRYWNEQNNLVQELEKELAELEFLAKKFGYKK